MALTTKHKQILDKAEQLFAEKGYEGTTVRDIAEFAGVNLAMISYYFGSKEKLLEALFLERMTVTRERIEFLISNTSLTTGQKLDMLIDDYIDRVMLRQAFYKVMLLEQVTNKNSKVVELLRSYKISFAQSISALIREGQKGKKNKKDIDIVLLLSTMTGTVTNTLVNKEYYREINDLKKLSPADFDELLKLRLSNHIKQLFKAILGYE